MHSISNDYKYNNWTGYTKKGLACKSRVLAIMLTKVKISDRISESD